MMPFTHHVELLVFLGLTLTEAKIFWALCTLGNSTARLLSENTGVAREVVYQIMPTLQSKGLIETVLTAPQTYRAIPAECAFEILRDQKNQENKKTEREINEALRALKMVQQPSSNNYSQITIIPKGKAVQSKMAIEMKNVQKSVDMICSWQNLSKWNRVRAKNAFNEAKCKNVNFQMLIEKETRGSNESSLRPSGFGFGSFDNLDIRFAPNASLTNMVIFDCTKVFIDIAQNQGLTESSLMYSNNPCFAPLALAYFQTNWEKAIPLQSITTALQNEGNN